MPEVVYEKVFTLRQLLLRGGRIQSDLLDVNGSQAVNLTLGIDGGEPNVFWHVHFGPTQNNGFGQTARGKFGANGTLAARFPVFGPKMMIVVENHSERDHHCDGNLYFIREVS